MSTLDEYTRSEADIQAQCTNFWYRSFPYQKELTMMKYDHWGSLRNDEFKPGNGD